MQTQGFYDKYKSMYYQHGETKVLMLAFCELFTAHCLEVKKSTVQGEPIHRYRFRADVPAHLLHRVEQIIAARLGEFKSFPSLLNDAARDIRKFYKIAGRSRLEKLAEAGTPTSLDTNQQFLKIIQAALETNAINYNVAPPGC
jgi:hypothetical protein